MGEGERIGDEDGDLWIVRSGELNGETETILLIGDLATLLTLSGLGMESSIKEGLSSSTPSAAEMSRSSPS